MAGGNIAVEFFRSEIHLSRKMEIILTVLLLLSLIGNIILIWQLRAIIIIPTEKTTMTEITVKGA